MIVFFFYVTAILVIFTAVAIIADLSLWIQQRRENAEPVGRLEDAPPDWETEF